MLRRVIVSLLLGACDPGPPPAEPTTWAVTWFVDPVLGDDAADGKTEATALKSLDRFDATAPTRLSMKANTQVLLRRGTALRLTATVQLHGHESGWVSYGAFGDPSLPKPILLGSAALSAGEWSAPDADGVRTLDWSGHLDTAGGRSANGVEQGPGNLWFFESDAPAARMTSWGFRKKVDVGAGSAQGDWHYVAASRTIRLVWPGAAPPFAEASINRLMIDYSGQSNVILQDLDLRFGGNYAINGHAMHHLRVRRIDMSFIGGGTKSRLNGVDQYVRLGNGFEVFGDGDDAVVEDCRVHQVYDSGMDPQFVGPTSITVRGLTFRNNLVSYPGLSGIELWERPTAPATAVLRDVTVENNTVIGAGRGWGYDQHDHLGQSKVGSALLTIDSRGTAINVVVRRNVFATSRAVIATDFRDEATKSFFRSFAIDENLWDLTGGGEGVVLFQGTPGQIEPDLTGSLVFHDLATWQQNTEVPGDDAHSVQGDAEFDAPNAPLNEDQAWLTGLPANDPLRPTRLGPFALSGDYRRTQATRGQGWGASLSP